MGIVPCIVTGLGNIGLNLLDVLSTRQILLRERYDLALPVIGVADSSGVAYAPQGLDLGALVAFKRGGGRVANLPGIGRPGVPALALVEDAEASLLFEATPTNLVDGQPGLDLVRTALGRGMHAVLASKGPLVLAFSELAALSDWSGADRPALRFSGAVGGALPTINVGRRDLAGSRISRVEAVLNGTSQVILGLMTEGQSFEQALTEAQRRGIVEPDPALDVDGWDAANKLVILANAVLQQPSVLAHVAVQGIKDVRVEELQAARSAGGRVSLLAVAELQAGADATTAYRLHVRPTVLPAEHPLARLRLDEMGFVFHTDIYGRLTVACADQGPVGAAAAMLRDVIDILH